MAAGIDQTDWAGLLKSAQNGQLQLLNVDSAALGKLTGYCEDLVADILGLINFVTGKNMPPKFDWYYNNQSSTDPKRPAQPKPFPASSYQFLSMKHLSDAFFDKANPELVDILGNHQAIVTDIANTFTAANKKYSITEGQNANTFVAPNARDHWPEISKYHAASSVSWANGPGLSTTASSGVSFDKSLKGRIDPLIELGGALHLYDFANIAMLVGSVGGDMLWLSGEWLALSQIWGNSIDTFTKNIKPVFTRGHWQGAGADRAIASLDKYLGTAETLRAGMVDMSHVVGNTANFLAFIYGHVPRYDQIKLNTNGTVNYVAKRGRSGDQAQTYAQQWWDKGDDTSNNKGFVAEMRQLIGQVPEFVDPNTAAPANNGGTGGGGGTGGNNGGNGGGSSNGGGAGNNSGGSGAGGNSGTSG
ncbi:hypothetical protein, partial [Nocardia amamiensis]|uniref:hypothetical protein n=1 Tax=Nocardia amamiensis TaxID=404578 RepID=UPI0033D396CC